MATENMTITEKMMAPTPPKWKKWSIILKSISTISAIAALAFPIIAPIAGGVTIGAGLGSLYCSSKVDHDTLDALAAVAEQAATDFSNKK